jgi:hypothetical protein
MLLRLLRPAVEVEFRPLPPFAKGGVGGGSSERSLVAELIVEERVRFNGGGARAGEELDLEDRADSPEPPLSNAPGATKEIDVAAELAKAVAEAESLPALSVARRFGLAELDRWYPSGEPGTMTLVDGRGVPCTVAGAVCA